MKKLLIALFVLMRLSSYSQEYKPLTFQGVVEVENTSAQELHGKCLNWFAETFNDSNQILRSSSTDQLIAKPVIIYDPSVFNGSSRTRGTISYTIKVQFKDNKYRYTISNFYHHGNPKAKYGPIDIGELLDTEFCPHKIKGTMKNWRNKIWNDLHANAKSTATMLIQNLKNEMSKKTSNDNDW